MNVQKCRARIACGFVVAQLKEEEEEEQEQAQCLPSAVVNKLTSAAEKSTSLLLHTHIHIHTYICMCASVLAYLLS